jgi:hypothetical protein
VLDDPLYKSINAKYEFDPILLRVTEENRYYDLDNWLEFGYIYNTLEKFEASIKWF